MSVNHYSSEIQEALWWQQSQSHHHMMESSKNNNIPNNATATRFWSHPLPPPANNYSFDLNNNEDDEENDEQLTDERENTSSSNNNNNNNYNILRENEESMEVHEIIPKQPLFEKPLTPSDVGKLNRLVIPKQHAEKYFPLNNNNNGGSNESGEKGLLLSFEDELGKPWRFRYSYWNSSQSYVFTKGWSRFVKEKRLDAGDVVLFQRHRIDCDRLFIGWRRRSAAAAVVSENNGGVQSAQTGAGGGGWTGLFSPGHHPYPAQTQQAGHGPANSYQPDCLHAASGLQGQTTQPSNANANSKRLRLFGVNLDLGCQTDESEPPPPEDGSSVLSQTQTHYHHPYQYHTNSKLQAYNHQNHKDINFSRDVNQTKYHQG